MSSISENWSRLTERIEMAANRAGRDPDTVEVCAVTKTADMSAVREAVRCGARILGESRVQAAEPKISGADDLGGFVRWHMIGHLQRNKARRAVELFDRIESVDGLELARRLSDLGSERGRPVSVLLEVRTSPEESKGGVSLESAPDMVAEARELPGLDVRGLMTMAPNTSNEAPVRECFVALRELRDDLGGVEALPVLSMGMTNDFEIAVEEGSTLVRVGTGIFG